MRSQPLNDIRFLYDLKSPARDGVELSCDVFLPQGTGPFPVIFLRTPYDSLRDVHIDWAVWWARRGYAVAIQENRGRMKSAGVYYSYHDDGRDGHDALEWIAEQPWCNGKIGMSGRSYGALVQWQAAPYRSPHLTAMAPQVVMGDFFGECHRQGGAVQWALTIMAAVTYWTTVHLTQKGCTHIFGNNEFFRRLPLIDADVAALGRPIPFFRDWFEHSVYDDYWRAINTHEYLSKIDAPVCQQAAWYDSYADSMFRMWNGLRENGYSDRARKNQKIYVVPWTHQIPEGSKLGDIDFGPQAYVDLNQEDLRWFDYWLKEIDTGIMDEPPVKIFVMGRNTWRFENEWPLARTVFTPYYLHSAGRANTLQGNGTLTPDSPGNEPPDHFDYDPADPVATLGGNNTTWTMMKFAADPVYPGPIDQRSIERRDDVLVYSSPVLDADLEVTGPLEMVLYAASSAIDTDFTAKLVDVHPDGRAIHLSEGILRARHRKSMSAVEFLQRGEVDEFRIRMAPTSNVFLKGHRIRVEISSSNFPRFDRNLNTGGDIATGTEWQIAHQTVLHNSRHASHILLPIIPA